MSKHEAQVPRTKYIVNLVFAILISFGIGLVVGYFFSGNGFNITKTSSNNTIQKLNTKELQINKVKELLTSYYDINNSKFIKFKNESIAQSSSTGKTQDEVFKEKLNKAYQEIMGKEKLDIMKKYINDGSLRSDYYTEFFDSQEGSQIKSVQITEVTNSLIKAKVTITNSFDYDKLHIAPNADDFIKSYKGIGIAKDKYVSLIALNPEKINTTETKDGTITIENINNKWYITAFDQAYSSTEIKTVTYKGKTLNLSEFIKQYLSK